MAFGRPVNARAIRKLGGMVVLQLYLTSRLASLYEPGHPNVTGAAEALRDRFQAFFKEVGRLTIRARQGHAFCNDVRLRLDGATRPAVRWLAERFEQSGLRSFAFLPGLTERELQEIVPLLSQTVWEEGEPPPALGRDLRAAGVEHAQARMRTRREPERRGEERAEVSAQAMAGAIYHRLLAVSRDHLERTSSARGLVLKDAKFLVQQTAELIREDAAPLLRLLRSQPVRGGENGYLERHLANVCVLSLAVATRLGLSRRHLLALGCAALVYDVGMVRVPQNLREVPGRLPPPAEKLVRRHALWSAAAALGGVDATAEAYVAAAVAARHHPEPRYPSLVSGPLELYTEIAVVCDRFDALTSRRPWRNAFPPADALEELLAARGEVAPDLVRVLANVVGVYPAGAVVELSTGEVGIVYGIDPNALHPDPQRPRVKLLLGRGGQSVDGRLVSLTERDRDGGYLRSVVRILESAPLEVTVEDMIALF